MPTNVPSPIRGHLRGLSRGAECALAWANHACAHRGISASLDRLIGLPAMGGECQALKCVRLSRPQSHGLQAVSESPRQL